MFSKCKLLVLLLALGVFAEAPISKSSVPFSFVQTGVLQQVSYSVNGMKFSYKRIVVGKQGMQFSWSLPQIKANKGSLSLYTVAGKLVRTLELNSNTGNCFLNATQTRMASGIYFASLSYGQFKKNLKIVY